MDLYNNEIVSVVIPVYNSEKFITDTIKSVLDQTYKNIEIVLVDDCSNDYSRELIEKFMKDYHNIYYYLQEKNGGAAIARNKALDISKGRYVAFLDSDDLWYPKKIEKQLELMKKTDAAICFASIEMIDDKNNIIKRKRSIKDKINYKFLLRNTMIATSSVIVDRKIIGGFQMPLIRSGQDYATWLQLMRNGINAYGIDEVLVKYRKISSSLSNNKFESMKQVRDIQIYNEKIHPLIATFNTMCFAVNAFKKHYL